MAASVTQENVPVCPVEPSLPGPPFRLGHRRWLDGLRGVAILLVLAFHFHLLPGGALGVDVFFVLSGFLITNLLADEWQRRGDISLKHFYLRRALRLLPAFVLLLLVFVGYTLLVTPRSLWPYRWHELAVAGLYVANWPSLHGASMTMLGHTWSLSLEEQFYLIWPALLLILFRCNLSRRRVLTLVVIGILASATLRVALYHQHRIPGPEKTANVLRLYMGLDTRADALLAGCLAGLLAVWGFLPNSKRFVTWMKGASIVALGILLFCTLKRDLGSSQYYHGLFTAVALAVAVLIVRLLVAPTGLFARLLESTPLVASGRISYGLYLFHIPVLAFLGEDGLGWAHPGKTALVAGLTYAAALVSFFCVERPFLRLKDAMGKSKPAADASANEPAPRRAVA